MKINQMKTDESFEGFYLIKSVDLRRSRIGSNYLAFTFQDDTGEIQGKLWDAQSNDISEFTEGKVVYMKGRREVYHNTPQVNQIYLRLPEVGEPNDPEVFKAQSPVDGKELRDYLEQMVERIDNHIWKQIVMRLYERYDTEFYSYPAAKTNHHAFKSGLAYHTATMVQLADKVGDIYPQLNKSLLFAGIMLHDLAKVIELTGPGDTNYTIRGNLIGHIALLDEELTKILLELKIDDSIEDVIILRHVLLSHHGSLEYGSPVRPQVMEAEILHIVDNLDAEMMMMTAALNKISEGEITSRVSALGNRSFYKPNFDN